MFTEWKKWEDWKQEPSMCISRLQEIVRILRPEGHLYIGGGSQHGKDAEKVLEVLFDNHKNIKMFNWSSSKVEIISQEQQ